MSIVSANAEGALFWRRVSAVGRTMVHAFLLHMILILTSYDKKLNTLKLILLYLPGILSMFVFSLSPSLAPKQYHFVMAEAGWTNITSGNIFSTLFHVYYSIYMIINFVLIAKWKNKSPQSKIQAEALLKALVSTLILGLLSDVVLDLIFKSKIPHLGPIVALPPLLTIFYLTKKNNLMQKGGDSDWDQIVNEESRKKMFVLISTIFLGGGTFNFVQYFLPQLMNTQNDIKNVFLSSAIFYATGILIALFQLIKKQKLKNFFISFVISLSIPSITLSYISTSSVTIWAIPIVLILIFIVLDNKATITAIMISGVLTQFFVWEFAPKGPVLMDEIDFVLRAVIIFFAYAIGFSVNKVYIKRLKENIYQTKFQKIISETSLNFINLNKDNYKDDLTKLLEKISYFIGSSKSYIYKFNTKERIISDYYEWSRFSEEADSRRNVINKSYENFTWLNQEFKKKNVIHFENTLDLPNKAIQELILLNKKNVKSSIAIPIEEAGETVGFVGCDCILKQRKWSSQDIDFLRTMSYMLGAILAKIQSQKEIELLAYYDHLTGLANRTLFYDRLTQAIYLANRNKKFLGVMFLDLDSFKIINDTMGHSGGDFIIKQISTELKNSVRESDSVARFGGDEFLVLFNNISEANNIIKMVDKIMKVFKKPFIIDDQEFFITFSAGTAIYPIDGEDADSLIKNADIAMYRAKTSGKNRHLLCTEDMKKEVEESMLLSNSLYRALEKNEFSIHYQPQVKIESGEIIGFEALLRWNHPKFGMVPPNVFIPLAEKNGLINSIGEWVLKTACKQNKTWQEMGFSNIRMAVNLSLIQFKNPNILEVLNKILNETGLDPKYLELEITESIAIGENIATIHILENLKKLGLSISIDDFGTEYSSLNRLKLLPIDRLKIDMQFIQAIENNEKDQAIVNVIINLAKNLGLHVLAEGVETKTQLDFLTAKKCDEVQGFYYYKPLPAFEIETMLKEKIL